MSDDNWDGCTFTDSLGFDSFTLDDLAKSVREIQEKHGPPMTFEAGSANAEKGLKKLEEIHGKPESLLNMPVVVNPSIPPNFAWVRGGKGNPLLMKFDDQGNLVEMWEVDAELIKESVDWAMMEGWEKP